MSTIKSFTPYPAYKAMVDKFTINYKTNKPWNQEYLDLQQMTISDCVHKYTKIDIWNEVMECVKLLERLGINMKGKVYTIDYSHAIKTYGTCRKLGNNHYRICINEEYLRSGTIEKIHNTIMHEVIHSCDGCMNHGRTWKAIAAQVNNHYAYTPIARTDRDEEYLTNIVQDKYKYQLVCQGCGATWNYIRKSNKAMRVAKSATSYHIAKNGCICPGPFKFITL